jgi:hypothetical protein
VREEFPAGGAAAGEHPAGEGENGADEAARPRQDYEGGKGGVRVTAQVTCTLACWRASATSDAGSYGAAVASNGLGAVRGHSVSGRTNQCSTSEYLRPLIRSTLGELAMTRSPS